MAKDFAQDLINNGFIQSVPHPFLAFRFKSALWIERKSIKFKVMSKAENSMPKWVLTLFNVRAWCSKTKTKNSEKRLATSREPEVTLSSHRKVCEIEFRSAETYDQEYLKIFLTFTWTEATHTHWSSHMAILRRLRNMYCSISMTLYLKLKNK